MKLLTRRILGKDFSVDVKVVKEKEAKPSIFKRVKNFVVETVVAAKNTVVDFVVGLWHHAESVIILVLASIGLSTLIAELPFILTLPLWFEAIAVIPFISVCIILILVKVAEIRGYYRMEKAAA